MVALGKFLDRIYLYGAWLAGLLLVLLCCLVLYSIASRLFGFFAGGASDVAGYVMATSTFMAMSYTFRTGGHIRVSLLTQRFSGVTRRAIETWALGFVAAVGCYIAFYMTRLMLDSYEWGERSEGADAILMWIPQTPVALGSILFAIATLHTLALAVFDYDQVNPEKSQGEGPNEI